MADLAGDAAALILDTLATLEALRRSGTDVLPMEPGGSRSEAGGGEEAAPRRVVPPQRAEPQRDDSPKPWTAPPQPRPAPPSAAPRVSPTPPPSPPRTPPPSARAPSPPTLQPAPPSREPAPGGAGLFGGRWAAFLEEPGDQLARVVQEAGPTCAACGAATAVGRGDPRARLAVLAEPMGGEAAEMFDRMLVRVLALERKDVFLAPARRCGACAEVVRRQIDVVRPRVVLAMGAPAAALVGARGPGAWLRWGETDTLATFHPDDLLARPDDKRAAFEHLKLVASRL